MRWGVFICRLLLFRRTPPNMACFLCPRYATPRRNSCGFQSILERRGFPAASVGGGQERWLRLYRAGPASSGQPSFPTFTSPVWVPRPATCILTPPRPSTRQSQPTAELAESHTPSLRIPLRQQPTTQTQPSPSPSRGPSRGPSPSRVPSCRGRRPSRRRGRPPCGPCSWAWGRRR